MQLNWISKIEKTERVRHTFWIFIGFAIFVLLLFLISLPDIESIKNNIPPKVFAWISRILLVLAGAWFSYHSLGELLQLVIPPSFVQRTKRYHILFTVLTLGPLFFLALATLFPVNGAAQNGGNGGKEEISRITNYVLFQLYFLLANWVGWNFFIKFFLPDIGVLDEDKKSIKKSGGRLFKWHYLGWTSFFSLSICFPPWAIILCIAISFFNSASSFAIGRKIGHRQLSCFSPNKTVEGCLGAIILSFLLFGLFSSWFVNSGALTIKGLKCQLSPWLTSIWVFLISVISHLGDNTFSVCKRALGYKNFGRFFGREIGGFWDRFDSSAPMLFFTSIVMWIFFAVKNKTIGIL